MPRKLPWLEQKVQKKESREAAAPSPALAPKHDRDSSPDLVDLDLNPLRRGTPQPRQRKRKERTPSTSPPPAPPEVEYMREGYDADDIFMMVEDEFLSTAKVYTQHIHHAEYVRLKKLARSRGAGTLQAISRGVDGTTAESNGLRFRREAEDTAKKIRNGVKHAGYDSERESSESEDEYMQDPQLAGLMTVEKRLGKDLSSMTKTRSNTRAAAGYSQSPHNVERKRDALAGEKKRKHEGTLKPLKPGVYPPEGDSDLTNRRARGASLPLVKAIKGASSAAKVKDCEHMKYAQGSDIPNRLATPAQRGRAQTSEVFIAPSASVAKGPQKSSPTKESQTSTVKAEPISSPDTQATARAEWLAKRRADKARRERRENNNATRPVDVPTFMI